MWRGPLAALRPLLASCRFCRGPRLRRRWRACAVGCCSVVLMALLGLPLRPLPPCVLVCRFYFVPGYRTFSFLVACAGGVPASTGFAGGGSYLARLHVALVLRLARRVTQFVRVAFQRFCPATPTCLCLLNGCPLRPCRVQDPVAPTRARFNCSFLCGRPGLLRCAPILLRLRWLAVSPRPCLGLASVDSLWCLASFPFFWLNPLRRIPFTSVLLILGRPRPSLCLLYGSVGPFLLFLHRTDRCCPGSNVHAEF